MALTSHSLQHFQQNLGVCHAEGSAQGKQNRTPPQCIRSVIDWLSHGFPRCCAGFTCRQPRLFMGVTSLLDRSEMGPLKGSLQGGI